MLDPEQVPATPVYSAILSATGEATVNGEAVDRLPGHDARMAVVADLRRRAALRGRPVRATAKEVDGTVRPLIVTPDGEVLELKQPHPTTSAATTVPAPASGGAPQPAAPAEQSAHTHAEPDTAPAPRQHPGPEAAPEPEPAKPTDTAKPDPADAWREQALAQLAHLEQHARAHHGPHSEQAQHWARLRSALIWGAPPWEAAAELWIAALDQALTTEPPDSPKLRAWAQDAVRVWSGVTDPQRAASIAPRLHGVLRRLDGATDLIAALEQRLDGLRTTSTATGD